MPKGKTSQTTDGNRRKKEPGWSCEPIGLNRVEAAFYVGISPGLFDELVADGRMPSPRMANSRVIWDREELRLHFKALPRRGGTEPENPWDHVTADPLDRMTR